MLWYLPTMNVTERLHQTIVSTTVGTADKCHSNNCLGLFVFIVTPSGARSNNFRSWSDWPLLVVLAGPDWSSWNAGTLWHCSAAEVAAAACQMRVLGLNRLLTGAGMWQAGDMNSWLTGPLWQGVKTAQFKCHGN